MRLSASTMRRAYDAPAFKCAYSLSATSANAMCLHKCDSCGALLPLPVLWSNKVSAHVLRSP